MALVALSVVERRLDAVRAVLAGASVTEVVAAGVVSASVAGAGRAGSPGVAAGASAMGRCPDPAGVVADRAAVACRTGVAGGAGAVDVDDQPGPAPPRAGQAAAAEASPGL